MGRLGLCRQDLGRRRADDRALQKIEMGDWVAELSYRQWMFGEELDRPRQAPAQRPAARRRRHRRDRARPIPRDRSEHSRAPQTARGLAGMQLRVEARSLPPDGRWEMERVWNGDQVDWGLNLMDEPLVLKGHDGPTARSSCREPRLCLRARRSQVGGNALPGGG